MTPQRLGAWRQPDFRKFWFSEIVSLGALQFGTLTLPLIAIDLLHASAGAVGLLSALGALPWLVFGLLVGVGLDRTRRRPVIVAAHLGRALLLLSIPAAAVLDVLCLAQLYVVACASGGLAMCFETARHAYLPSLLPAGELAEGNRAVAATDGLTRVAGPGIAGSVIQIVTAPVAVAMQAIMFVLAGGAVWRIRTVEPPLPRRVSRSVRAELRQGLAYTWNEPAIRAFTLAEATFQFFFAALQAVLLVFFARQLHLSAGVIGLIFTAGSAGGVLGALVARQVERRLALGQTLLIGSTLRWLGLVAIPFATVAGPYAIGILVAARGVSSLGWTIWQINQETTQQLLLPNDLRGRVTASTLFLVRGGSSIGAFAGAGLAASLGVVPTVVVTVAGAGLGTLWLLASPPLRKRYW